jgi:GxxExxY protein
MQRENMITKAVLDLSFPIHSALGPGLLEKVYERILVAELQALGFAVKNQVPITIKYKNLVIEEAFKADIIVEDIVLLELKASEVNHPVYHRQLLSYLKLSSIECGLLINFGSEHLKDGIKRMVNSL